MKKKIAIGVDIGGSHISCAAFECSTRKYMENTFAENNVDNHADAETIVDAWGKTIRHTLGKAGLENVSGIGFAMPGPFDYVKSGVQALVDAYSVNLSWDVAWAQNWDLSDHLHSRNDDLWVYAAPGGGLYDAFNVDIPFWGTVNLLDPFDGNTTQSLSRGRVGSVGSAIRRFAGNQVARYSMRHAVEWATQVGKRMVNTVDYYTHPLIKDRLGRVLYRHFSPNPTVS